MSESKTPKRVTLNLKCPLSPDDTKALMDEVDRLHTKLGRARESFFEKQKEIRKRHREEMRKETGELANAVRQLTRERERALDQVVSGHTVRPVECEELYDPETGLTTTIRLDSREVVLTGEATKTRAKRAD